MEIKSTKKTSRLSQVVLGIICAALFITVLAIFKQNIELKKGLNKQELSEINRPDLIEKEKAAEPLKLNPPPRMTQLPDNMSDKEKVKKLESQIADMQAWQDYLEASLQKYQNEEEKREAVLYEGIRGNVKRTVEAFAEEVDISPRVKTELIELLTERDLSMRDIWSGDLSQEEQQEEMEHLTQKYNDIIAEKYPEYNEYLKVQGERYYVNRFKKTMSPENQLDKDQEKRLIAAFYNDNQIFEETYKEFINSLSDEDKVNPDEKMLENILEMQKGLNSRFLDSAGTILSESQLQEFQKHLDSEFSRMENELKRMKDRAKEDRPPDYQTF